MFTRQRTIDWSAAMRGLSAERRPFAPGERAAAVRAQAYAALAARTASSRPLVVAGRYDRSAIMRAAVACARERRGVTGEPWSLCLSAALRGVWATARAYRTAGAH